jgi:DsbC/DsbD-like thiol-disulfide interchange protein
MRPTSLIAATLAALLATAVVPAATSAAELASDWKPGHNVRTRLIAGSADGTTMLAGLHATLAPGWKTYWRNPGDAGGVPPYFTFDGSTNLKSARVLFPAPQRLADASGEAIGYKGDVVFPIEVVATEPGKPVTLKVRLEYGVCREICIPAEADHVLNIPAGGRPLPPALAAAAQSVPVVNGAMPKATIVASTVTGAKPALTIEVHYPSGAKNVDLFLEAPDNLYVPLPKKAGPAGVNRVRFVVDLAQSGDAKAFSGKALTATAVSSAGHSESTVRVP